MPVPLNKFAPLRPDNRRRPQSVTRYRANPGTINGREAHSGAGLLRDAIESSSSLSPAQALGTSPLPDKPSRSRKMSTQRASFAHEGPQHAQTRIAHQAHQPRESSRIPHHIGTLSQVPTFAFMGPCPFKGRSHAQAERIHLCSERSVAMGHSVHPWPHLSGCDGHPPHAENVPTAEARANLYPCFGCTLLRFSSLQSRSQPRRIISRQRRPRKPPSRSATRTTEASPAECPLARRRTWSDSRRTPARPRAGRCLRSSRSSTVHRAS